MVLNVGRYLEFPTVICVGNVGHATLVTHNVSKIPIALTAEVRCHAIDNVPSSATDFFLFQSVSHGQYPGPLTPTADSLHTANSSLLYSSV